MEEVKIVDQQEIARQKQREIDYPKPLRRRVFTWYNYSEENVEYLRNISADKIDYLIFGFELNQKGQKHLQGYVEFSKAISGPQTKVRLDPVLGKKSPISFEKARDGRQANINYCSKVDSGDDEAIAKYGTKFFIVSFIEKQKGKRTDWHDIHDKIVHDNATFSEVAAAFPEQAIKCHAGIDRLIRANEEKVQWDEFVEQYDNVTLRPWQAQLVKELGFEAKDRKIIWIYETVGNVGKSWMSRYLVAKCKAARYENGRTTDIAMAYKREPIVVFDFSRSTEERLNYGVIESLKNGSIFSGKYCSVTKYFKSPHIVCFANWPPKLEAMSADRWDIRCLNNETNGTDEKRLPTADCLRESALAVGGQGQPTLAHTCNTGPQEVGQVWYAKYADNYQDVDNIASDSDEESHWIMENL